jgi:hypothetical protein
LNSYVVDEIAKDQEILAGILSPHPGSAGPEGEAAAEAAAEAEQLKMVQKCHLTDIHYVDMANTDV